MAKFSASYRLCPLINQTTFIGVSDESVNGCVIITLGKKMVIRYQLSNQKQVNSWSSRDKLSAPVVFDTVSQKYIGIFNNNQISTWEESCVQLSNLKKFKFAAPLECVLTSASAATPVVVYRSGHILPLQQALDRRKDYVPRESKLSQDETICDTHLIVLTGFSVVVLFTKTLEQEYSVHLIPLEEGLLGESHIQMRRKAESDVKLISYSLVNYETCQLLTLWSDGELFSLELPTRGLEQFPGRSLTTLTTINPRYQTAILPLSSTHLAVYGADTNDEGALLFIFNSQLCVTQCKQSFKLYTPPARLWAGGKGSILLADTHYLLVVPYQLGQQRLVALIGSQDADGRLLKPVDWGEETDKDIKQEEEEKPHSTSLDTVIKSYMEEGMSQRMICQSLFIPSLDSYDFDGLKNLMTDISDIPESCIISVIDMCLHDIERPGSLELLRLSLSLPVTPDLSTLQQLRHKLKLPAVLTLLGALIDAMLQSPADPQLIEWATLLLDAFYQQYLLSRDEAVIERLTELKTVVEKQIEEMAVWQQLEPLLLQLQSRQNIPDPTHRTNTSYCIEQIRLY